MRVGDSVTSFLGERYTVTGWAKNGHNRVYVTNEDGEREFFVSVFDLTWDHPPHVPAS